MKKHTLEVFCLKPVESAAPWRDDRPGPNAYHHGVYTPVMRVGGAERPKEPGISSIAFEMPKKPRGTV